MNRTRLLIVMILLLLCLSSPLFARDLTERMAAWGQSLVSTDEQQPNSCVGTYVMDHFSYMESINMAKLSPGVEVDGKLHFTAEAKAISVEDFPGGVEAKFELAGVKVITRITPLMVGREPGLREGAYAYEVKTIPSVPVVVRCGGAAITTCEDYARGRSVYLRNDAIGKDSDSAVIEDGIGFLGSTIHTLIVGVKASGELSVQKGDNGGQILSTRFANGHGSVVISFANDHARAKQITALDPAAAFRQVSQHYAKLLQCRVRAPEKELDQAFGTALYNLEYCWLPPYGWVECIHHWYALWHMQDAVAAEWIGQTDRAKLCATTLAHNLLPDGSIPQFMPSGRTRKDFGGSNQFFAWQVRHYWNFTADRSLLSDVAGSLDTVIEQTFKQYDPDGDGLLAWGQQIGNQEDYVSTPFNGTTPSVEGINMLRTAAEVARALGQVEKARAYEARANLAIARLRSELWQSDLGRFAFYKDPHGEARLDGQYHTQVYPVIYGILDPLDSYTSIRHLFDRMTGKDGEAYCSNNFPDHMGGTWGMQAGESVQPWTANGLAAVGLRNDAIRPLLSAAKWAMNPDHRGSWPEIALEPIAAYFSAPAGLFIQSTIEALFGLKVYKPEGYMEVSPCFPDKWPSASLDLPDYHASYIREASGVRYTVVSTAPLARRLRWKLPPCRVKQVTVDGKKVKFDLAPGVNCVVLSVNTKPATHTEFRVVYNLIDYHITHANSIAEGDELKLQAKGCTIERVDDRCGVLTSMDRVSETKLTARIRNGQLEPYMGYGRLGQLNFSKRTFFVLMHIPGGARFWQAVDLTILPRFECTGIGDVTDAGTKLLVRNNTFAPIKGEAVLIMKNSQFRFDVSIPARAEKQCTIAIPTNMLALFSPGAISAVVVLPGQKQVDVKLIASKLFDTQPKLMEFTASRMVQVSLPKERLVSDQKWRDVRQLLAYVHAPWVWSKPPMESLAGKTEVSVPGLPVVKFKLEDRQYVPISAKLGSPGFVLDMNLLQCKKLYLLVIPFLDNHDTFSTVGRVDVRAEDGTVISRTLRFPGDLDWWAPAEVVWAFGTAHADRPDRFGLLKYLSPNDCDWADGKPPAFPQSEYWATSLPLKTPSSVMNVIEVDLPRMMSVQSLTLSAIGADPAFGLVAVSAETVGGGDLLAGTRFLLPPLYRDPRMLFSFDKTGDMRGWRTEGEAFSVAPVPGLFEESSLNSRGKAGESATGKAISPDFTIGTDDTNLVFRIQGGNSIADEGPGALSVRLIDSQTGEALAKLPVTGSHLFREAKIPVDKWHGKNVHLEMIDNNTNSSWAWLGVKNIALVTQ